jgi:uncharacterized protein YxeA
MKKIITLIMAIAILATAASASFAQGRGRRSTYCEPSQRSRTTGIYDSRRTYDNTSRVYDNRGYANRVYDNSAYNNGSYYDYRGRSVWDRNRDKITVVAGTAGGAAIGGLIGGRRGAVIGAITGAAGSALYTYKVRNKGYRY